MMTRPAFEMAYNLHRNQSQILLIFPRNPVLLQKIKTYHGIHKLKEYPFRELKMVNIR